MTTTQRNTSFVARVAPLASGILVFGLVALWTFTATPRYRSTALLRIESGKAGAPFLDELKAIPGASLMGLGQDEVDTEIGVLKSRRVADAVIETLALMVQVKPATVPRRELLDVQVIDTTFGTGALTFTRNGAGYAVTSEDMEGRHVVPAFVRAGDSLLVGGVHFRVAAGKAPALEQFTVRVLPRYKAQRLLEDRLDIRTQEGGSRLVEVSYEDPDRELAAAVVRRLVDTYVGFTFVTTDDDDRKRLAELRREVNGTAVRLASAEEQLRRFKEQRRLVVPDEQATAQLKRIGVAQQAVDQLEVERTALAQLLDLVNSRARGGRESVAYRQLATFPSLITNRGIQDLLLSMIELETKRSELLVRRTANNDEVAEITRRIGELEHQLERTGTQYLESLEQQIGVATKALSAMTTDLDAFPRTEMEFVRLYRERTLLSEAQAVLMKQLKQMELQTAMRSDRVRIIDTPRVADAEDPAFPRVAVQLVLGVVLAVTVALLVAFGRALFATSGSQESVIPNQ